MKDTVSKKRLYPCTIQYIDMFSPARRPYQCNDKYSLVDAHLISTTLPGPGQRYKLYNVFLLLSCPGMPGHMNITQINVLFDTL